MPRDSNGLYALPDVNPVGDGDIIEADWANTTMSDIAVQLNNVITRDGLLGFVEPTLLVNGSALLPALAFVTQPNLGLFRDGINALAVAAGGASLIKFSTDSIDSFKPVGLLDGSMAAPSLRFTADSDTGMYRTPAGEIGFVVDGMDVLKMSPTGVAVPGLARFEDNIVINQIDPASWCGVIGEKAGVRRWMVRFADQFADAVGDLGSDFVLMRYNNAGELLDSPFHISRATGRLTLASLTVNGMANLNGGAYASGNFQSGNDVSAPGGLYSPNLFLGGISGGVAPFAHFYRGGPNQLSLQLGDNQAAAHYFHWNHTEFYAPMRIRAGQQVRIDGTGMNAYNDPNASALHLNGQYGGGIFFNEGSHFVQMLGINGTAQIRTFQVGIGDWRYNFSPNGDFLARICYGHTDSTHYTYVGWNGANSVTQYQHGGYSATTLLDAAGNLIFYTNGAQRGYFGLNGNLYLSQPGGVWHVPKVESSIAGSDGNGWVNVTFASAFGNPCITTSVEHNAERFVAMITARSAAGFTARCHYLNGTPAPGVLVHWQAVEVTQ